MKLLFLLFPLFAIGQNVTIKKDSVIITIKLKITQRGTFLKDSLYQCGKEVNLRIRKDSLYYYAKHQYIKIKR